MVTVLELTYADGATVTAGPDTLGWPRLLAGRTEQLRPCLEPVLGVRALLPVVQASGTTVTGRLLDVEDTARLTKTARETLSVPHAGMPA